MSCHKNWTGANITRVSQVSQQNAKHQRLWGVWCKESTIFFAIFTGEMIFSFSYFHFCHCEVVQKRNCYSETQINIYPLKSSIVSTSDLIIKIHNICLKISGKGWQLGHWPRTTRCQNLLQYENSSLPRSSNFTF